MLAKFSTYKLDKLAQLIQVNETCADLLCFYFFFLSWQLLQILSFITPCGNLYRYLLLVMMKLFLSLTFSDLAAEILPQLMLSVFTAAMLKVSSTKEPILSHCRILLKILTVCYCVFGVSPRLCIISKRYRYLSQ